MNKVTMLLRDLGADGFIAEARNVYLTIHGLNLLGITFSLVVYCGDGKF